MSISTVIARIAQMKKNAAPDSEKIRTALIRIGTTLEAEIKLQIRRRGLIDTGNLLNSIHYEARKTAEGARLEVGSYGVPYAAVWEFGFQGIQNVRESQRTSRLGRSYGVRAHTRNVDIKARPYIQPSLIKRRQFIIDLIRSIGAAT